MNELHGRKNKDGKRRQSYADLESYMKADQPGGLELEDDLTDDENDPLLNKGKQFDDKKEGKKNTFPFTIKFIKW